MFNKLDDIAAKLEKVIGEDGVKTDVKIELGTDTIVQLILAILMALIIAFFLHGLFGKLVGKA
jgi:hypothetical protein